MKNRENTRSRKTKKYRIKSKSRFITFLVICMMLIGTAVTFATGLNDSIALTQPQTTEVEIVAGDTLWDIANEYKSKNTDTRKAVFEICKANNIQAGDLAAGMVIEIPANI